VIEAADAKGAPAARHDKMTVHIVISDIQLNDSATGWDVAEAYRALRSDLPIIYTSGNTAGWTRPVANSLFIDKPYQPAKIVSGQQLIAGND